MASQPQDQTSQQEHRAKMLGELVCSERPALLRQARSHSRRSEEAEDALSDACVQFLRFYDGPPGRDALRWMLVVVKRCAWTLSRQGRSRESRVAIGATGGGVDVALVVQAERDGPVELLERSEETTGVAELIGRLKPAEREALILRGLGYSYKEIAEMRGWSITKVNRCMSKGRAAVRRELERGVKS